VGGMRITEGRLIGRDCPDCGGLAYKICQTCYFEGKTGPACPTCENGRKPCTTCSSTGLKKAA